MLRRLARSLINAVVALVVIAAAVYAHTFTMDQDDLDAPLSTRAAAGSAAATGRFSARLGKVVAASSLRLLTTTTEPVSGRVMILGTTRVGTPDVFVVTTVSATSSGAPTRLADAWLRTADGVEYAATDRVGPEFTLADRPVQDGWWVDVVFVFEVPREALPGSSVVVTAPSSNGIYDEIYPGRYDQLLPEAVLAVAPDDAAAKRILDDVKSSWQLVAKE
ncbi:hypothetical protein [Sphaerisporangium corydalis]|uniref:DUF4352 domain-containing protein n=1 Tax=Sphaerisporangium corydalis TaxID=1441875 RepID=A0ABV9ELW1_9ACTN|nr:hypothetical protein [Sphaerisporangium corydalis]